ncbi:helix-turn-helix domain-containing protein [Paenibacillus aurantiacus]|uniref:Helix-turn-helix domain-containing protein n=1 Tax=Paenibacillus aurantiacus TaxID=1936118 RepID=A0ABV5KT53_9BACL
MTIELKLISLQEAADYLQVSRSTINRWRKDRGFPTIKIARDVYVDRNRMDVWIRAHAELVAARGQQEDGDGGIIVIGCQSRNAHMWGSVLIRELGLLDAELREMGGTAGSGTPRYRWVDLNGPRQLEEMVAGRLHIASLGDLPMMNLYRISELFPSFKARLLAFDGKSAAGSGMSCVVQDGSGIRDLSKLSKRTIKTLRHSSSWHRLSRSLDFASATDAVIVDQDSDRNFDDMLQASSDAWAVCEPYATMARTYGLGRLLPFEGCDADYLTGIVVNEKWLSGRETFVFAYLRAHLKAHQCLREQPAMAAGFISRATGFPFDIVLRVIASIRWEAAVYAEDLASLHGMNAYRQPFALPDDWRHLRRDFAGDHFLREAAAQLKLPIQAESRGW